MGGFDSKRVFGPLRGICVVREGRDDFVKGILRTVESATIATGLPLGLDKKVVLSINGDRLPWGRVCFCYSLPYSTCTLVRGNRIRILVVMRYRVW
jgi:hypothetical protein